MGLNMEDLYKVIEDSSKSFEDLSKSFEEFQSKMNSFSPILEKFEEFQSKLNSFSSILEKFGLDIITKMGQTNLKITQLTDKINDLDKATIEIKSMMPQLSNIIEHQKFVEDDLDLIKSLVKNIGQSSLSLKEVENSVDRDETVTSKKDLILDQLNDLKENLVNLDDPFVVKTILEQVKEDVFEFTGGHRILYEISQIFTILNSASSLNDLMNEENTSSSTIKNHLTEKITFWINKLMVKD